MADAAPVRKLLNMVLLLAIKDKASRHPLRAVRGRVQDAVPVRRRALRDGAAAAPPGPRHRQPHQGHVQPRHRRAPAAAGRPHRARTSAATRSTCASASCRPCSARACVIRVLDRTVTSASTSNKLGMRAGHPGRSSAQLIHKPNGIVLVTGPTGVRQDDHALLRAQRAERDRPTRSSPPRTRSSTTSTASSRCRSTPRSA